MNPRSLLAVPILLAVSSPPARAAGEVLEREITVEGAKRSYLIHVPSTWDRKRPIPVLFVFHGAGADAESLVTATGFGAMAEKENALVVFPRAPRKSKRFDVDPAAGKESVDVFFFDAMLARFKERFPVDERRVFATGFSNGAALCYRLAAARPDVVAAIAPVAGYLPSLERGATATPVPALHVHGTADRLPPPSLEKGSRSAVLAWAAWNRCGETATSRRASADGLSYRRVEFSGATPRSDVHLVLFDGEGHTWPGGPGGLTSRLIRDFLVRRPRDPPPARSPDAGQAR